MKPIDDQWGVLGPNGTFNGIIGMLESRQADISSAGLSVLLERTLAIDMSMHFHRGIITLIRKVNYLKIPT